MKLATLKTIYNGAHFCADCADCPIVQLDTDNNIVHIHDPAKPENGAYKMTVDEYNTLLKNAPKI